MKTQFKYKFRQPEMDKLLKKISSAIEEIAPKIVEEVGREVLHTVRQKAYVAEESYWHYWNNGRSKQRLSAGTIPKLLYSFSVPAWETKNGEFINKIAVENNNETGYLGNVAVFIEYGTINMPANPFFRSGIKTARPTMKKVVERNFKEIERQMR